MEYQRSIIFATTNGISALILPNGQCKARAEAHQEAVLIGTIPLQTTLTPYAKYSEWFLGILLLTYCSIYTHCKIQSRMR
jgi:apolipoprotein N-acyltransferase